MYVQVRTIDGKTNVIITVSKLTTVEEFKEKIKDALSVESSKQRLFYRGKQLEDGYKIFDYNINLNDVVQLMIKGDLQPSISSNKSSAEDVAQDKVNGTISSFRDERVPRKSEYFKVGDVIDALDSTYGAWFEAKIVQIFENESRSAEDSDPSQADEGEKIIDDKLLYQVKLIDGYNGDKSLDLTLNCIRPRTHYKYKFSELKEGDIVLVNYNLESPLDKGYWYDFMIEYISSESNDYILWGTVYVGKEKLPVQFVKLQYCEDILRIEKVQILHDVTQEENQVLDEEKVPDAIQGTSSVAEEVSNEENSDQQEVVNPDSYPEQDSSAPFCVQCKNKPNAKCKECGCHVCGLKDDPGKQLMCDECDLAYHLRCLDPPLVEVPAVDEWYCPLCKNDENEIVKAGEKLKESKKKAKLISSNSSTNRDWGKGMACVGRTKECTLVPSNHYGPIPGIEVGTCWKFRVQVSEAGVHRPHVAGIHGRESDGAYSIVLSGGYEDDVDDGETFMYTGSGGRDLSGNKRTAEQSCDQTLTRMNKALAINCNTRLNENGAKAKDWKGGKPIRVVRNYKLAKHSKYAPEEGNRYDGIYKVVEYYPQKGKSGFIVWRYVLRRDDPTRAPWTPEGKKHIESLGLGMIYPEGYLEAMAAGMEKDESGKETKKRKSILQETSSSPSNSKRMKLTRYELDSDVHKVIKKDTSNVKLWNMCKESLGDGKQKFLTVVNETFMCICCQELVHEPVTTECNHNFCQLCLKRAFNAEVYTCPCCRNELGEQYKPQLNTNLAEALIGLFPGYTVGR